MHRRQAIATLAAAAAGAAFSRPFASLEPGYCGGPFVRGFDEYCFRDSRGRARQVYVADGGGPPVILLHELPGLTEADLDAAALLAKGPDQHGQPRKDTYTVIAPLLFGQPGGEGDWRRHRREVCGAEQFACSDGEATSPHVAWLIELVRDVRQKWPSGQGVGVIGMCLTGAFPLAMLKEPAVVAPVLLQPTVPFNAWTYFGWFTDKERLGIHPDDLAAAKRRDAPILGIRYRDDWRCRAPRFNRLAREFGKRFFRLDLPGDHHSTIGSDFCDQAFLEVRMFLNQHLRSSPEPIGTFPRLSEPGVDHEVRKEITCSHAQV